MYYFINFNWFRENLFSDTDSRSVEYYDIQVHKFVCFSVRYHHTFMEKVVHQKLVKDRRLVQNFVRDIFYPGPDFYTVNDIIRISIHSVRLLKYI